MNFWRWVGESLRESIKRHEHFLALQLGLKRGMKVRNSFCLFCCFGIYVSFWACVMCWYSNNFFTLLHCYFRCWMWDVGLVDLYEKLQDLGNPQLFPNFALSHWTFTWKFLSFELSSYILRHISWWSLLIVVYVRKHTELKHSDVMTAECFCMKIVRMKNLFLLLYHASFFSVK